MNEKQAIATVIVVSENNEWSHYWQTQLSTHSIADEGWDMQFVAVSSYDSLVDAVLTETSAVAVLALHCVAANQVLPRVEQLRPEISINLMMQDSVEACSTDGVAFRVDGWLAEDEADRESVYKLLHGQLAAKVSTPFADTLRGYVSAGKDAWHTPGHSSGDSLSSSPWVRDFYQFIGAKVFQADLSVSVQVLDSLLEPSSVIHDAQELAARAFGASQTFFVTNGTSTANKVILQYLLRPGDKILLDRGSHKSTHHGVILCGATPVYLASEVNHQYGLYGPVSFNTIKQAITDNPEAKVLMLTSCTYDGMRYDLTPIIELAHSHGIKVMIDEAWYAHGRFHHKLRPTALEYGADYVTQSTHKMLSAFSQASMIHVNDPDFDGELFRDHLNMHTSTSPQYGMIASLDVARKQMQIEGYALLNKSLSLAKRLREQAEANTLFEPLSLEKMLPDSLKGQGIQFDPTKVTLSTERLSISAEQVQLLLFERFGIQIEKITHNTISVLITIGTTLSKLLRLEEALKQLSSEFPASGVGANGRAYAMPPAGEMAMSPREAFFNKGKLVAMADETGAVNKELVGKVACDQVVPYPPGVPVLVPGQKIDIASLEFLLMVMTSLDRGEVHGLRSLGASAAIRVVC